MLFNSLVYAIVVNYNSCYHTIECLESLFRIDYEDLKIVLVDNGSTDGSVDTICKWAEGLLDLYLTIENPMRVYSFPPVPKPIRYKTLDTQHTEIGDIDDSQLIIVSSKDNLGFAGANNIGIKIALSNSNCRFVWFVNNDTVHKRDALSQLVRCATSSNKGRRSIGMWGSKLLYYQQPERLNSAGGRYFKWIGLSRQIGTMEIDQGQYDKGGLAIDYPMGASIFVSRSFIEDVGMMSEDYFLYYEELDWTLRGRKKGWTIRQCQESVVYHKEGATIGSSRRTGNKSPINDYYVYRNRIVFTRKNYPYCLLSVILASLAFMIVRIFKVNNLNLRAIVRGIVDGIRDVRGKVDYV